MKKNIYVVGAVIIQNDQILCAQRGPGRTLANKWEFPGGKVEEGETPQQALKREIQEEMKCKIEIGEQVEDTTYEYDFGIVHLTTFYCKLLEGQPILTDHVAIKWMNKEDLMHWIGLQLIYLLLKRLHLPKIECCISLF